MFGNYLFQDQKASRRFLYSLLLLEAAYVVFISKIGPFEDGDGSSVKNYNYKISTGADFLAGLKGGICQEICQPEGSKVPCGMQTVQVQPLPEENYQPAYKEFEIKMAISQFRFFAGDQDSLPNEFKENKGPEENFQFGEVEEETLPANRAPFSSNLTYSFSVELVANGEVEVIPDLLSGATDPDGDPLSIIHFGNAVGTIEVQEPDCSPVVFENYFFIQQQGSSGHYTLTYLGYVLDIFVINIGTSGHQIITDFGALQHLAECQILNIRIYFTVGDNKGGVAPESYEDLRFIGVNDAPTDGNESVALSVMQVINGGDILPNLLDNAYDPDIGDTKSIVSFGDASVNSCDFSIEATATPGQYLLTYLNNPSAKAYITIDSDGTQTIVDQGALKYIAEGQPLDIRVNYTVGDNHGGLAAPSHEYIRIVGENDAPTDGNESVVFSLCHGGSDVLPNLLDNAYDPDIGDTKSIVSFGDASVNSCNFSIHQEGTSGHYVLTYLYGNHEQAYITINSDGSQNIEDQGALKYIADGQTLDIRINYTVGDNHGGLAAPSHEDIFITGENHAPIIDEEIHLGEVDIGSHDVLKGNLFSKGHAFDFDGDSLRILSVDYVLDGGYGDRDSREGFIGISTDNGMFTINTHTGEYKFKENSGHHGHSHADDELSFDLILTDGKTVPCGQELTMVHTTAIIELEQMHCGCGDHH